MAKQTTDPAPQSTGTPAADARDAVRLQPAPRQRELTLGDVFRSWWPLAASWMLMASEPVLIGAVVSRLPNADIHLAAWGGIVFPVALLVEAPIIMMLAASTALSRDIASYRWLNRAVTIAGFGLTVIHALLAFTPLYDHVVIGLIGPPPEIIESGRLGLRLMLPWSWAIADRRFHQGVLIACGRSRAVGVGTAVRLVVTVSALSAGYFSGALSGIAVAGIAIGMGVIGETIAARVAAKAVIHGSLRSAPIAEPLRLGRFLGFYLPLALTPLLTLATQPIGSASLSRMPDSLRALAIWPIMNGLVFLSGSAGVAYNEVVVHLAGRPGARPVLRRFLILLAAGSSVFLLAVATTPLLDLWFGEFSDLRADQVALVRGALWVAIPLPAFSALRSYLQGILVHAHRTRGVTEAVGIFLLVATLVLYAGVRSQWNPSLSVILAALVLGSTFQCAWLAWRVRLVDRVDRVD